MAPEMKSPASAATLNGAECESGKAPHRDHIPRCLPRASTLIAPHPDALARRCLFLYCREIADSCARRGFPIKWARKHCEIYAVNQRDRRRVSWLEAVEIGRAAWHAAAAECRAARRVAA